MTPPKTVREDYDNYPTYEVSYRYDNGKKFCRRVRAINADAAAAGCGLCFGLTGVEVYTMAQHDPEAELV